MTLNEKLILAIDLGTSGPKVAVFDGRGRVVAHDFEPTRLILLPGGGAEQDPDDWWRAIVTAVRRLLARGAVEAGRVAAIACTAQWSGTVVVDAGGRHLMNAMIWMDARGRKYARQITGGPLRIDGYGVDKLLRWIPRTGGIPGLSGKDPVAHILYIRDQRSEVYAATHKFLEPKDYLNVRLTGKFSASYDSITLHWVTDNRDPNGVEYDQRLLRLSGLELGKLPDLKRAVDILGNLQPAAARELGLSEDVQVVLGTPDIHSAALGSGAVRDFEPHLYIGTSSWLSCHVPFKKTDLLHNIASLPAAIPGRYLVGNEQQTSGSCLMFLRDMFLQGVSEKNGSPDVYQILNKMAASAPPGSEKVIFTPWLYGERTPVDDSAIRGGFYNISLNSRRDSLVRAGFEGVAYNSRWLLKYVEKFVGRTFDGINMIGGGARSALWCQIHADVLNRTIRQVKDPVLANVRGAAALAAVALGGLTFEEVAATVEIEQEFHPNPQHRAIYDELFGEFLNIYKQNRKMYARLNRGDAGMQEQAP